MYNLLVGLSGGVVDGSRMLEHTENYLKAYLAPNGQLETSRLLNLPTLVLPEVGFPEPQVAQLGRIDAVMSRGRDYIFRFTPSAVLSPIETPRIQELALDLGISQWEFNRTHWAVKDADLHGILGASAALETATPQVFRLPTELAREPDLVAVMMPFDGRFNAVYATLQQAAADAGFRCHRADDIWINDHIMDDVISLIWRSRAVISDLSSKNANVFYETGIAHTLGRDVIQIAQSMDDVPFDIGASVPFSTFQTGKGLLGFVSWSRSAYETWALVRSNSATPTMNSCGSVASAC